MRTVHVLEIKKICLEIVSSNELKEFKSAHYTASQVENFTL